MTPLRSAHAAALLLAVLTAGCAGQQNEEFFVRPGRFDYLACPDIAKAREDAVKREQELKVLIDRAEKDNFGPLIASVSYRGDYLKAQGEQKMLADVARQKNCAAEAVPASPLPAPPRR